MQKKKKRSNKKKITARSKSSNSSPGEMYCGMWVTPLRIREGGSSEILFESPAQGQLCWPRYPFSLAHRKLKYSGHCRNGEIKEWVMPLRIHVRVFRKWDWKALVSGVEWPKWKARLTARCNQRHEELPFMDIDDICDVLMEVENPNEHKNIIDGVSYLAARFRRIIHFDPKTVGPNTEAVLLLWALDLAIIPVNTPRPLYVLSTVGVDNGLTWLYKTLADFLNISCHNLSIENKIQIYETLLKYLSSGEKPTETKSMMLKEIAGVLGVETTRTERLKKIVERIGGELIRVSRQSHKVRVDGMTPSNRDRFKKWL